ncbi:hypothetical protein NA57DRAFT_71757 [Rhizodiscina lignyota]|uniref:Transglycosylase SLT domain-containing protein n=1 Tax=Rhizodiscina lignyota TaxID=1504668 RepID=A0A9P4IP11_9PEZI|nr:hypothetical protein NA57DRAFT_71757 [Rhizodiscina lignyota]
MFGPTLTLSLILSIASALPLQDTPPSLDSRSPIFGTVSKVDYSTGDNWYSPNFKKGATAPAPSQPGPYDYQCFSGDIEKYPDISNWLSFHELFQINKPMMLLSNSEDIVSAIYHGIEAISKDSNVDARVILAMIMQESTGKVNTDCTGGHNCGLMQANVGSTSFDPKDPEGSIKQMIEDGVLGTSAGPGLIQYMSNDPTYAYTNNHWTSNPFAAARCYNSGTIDPSGNLDKAAYGVKSYVNDIGNRLLGWDGADSGCAQMKCGLTSQKQCQSAK